jgi:hypothetical protein
MADRIIERNDGVTTERTTEMERPTTTVVERRGSGAGILWALIGLALIAIVAFFLLNMNRQEAVRTEAVSDAAASVSESVGDAAGAVGDAADRAADSVSPN